MADTIIKLAQDIVGTKNIALCKPCGQFGTRLAGGDDAASDRYVSTHLHAFVNKLFVKSDDPVLNWLTDEGTIIEPETYMPIVPMLLVNGACGIATGWNTRWLPHSLSDVMYRILDKLSMSAAAAAPWQPFFAGHKGTVEQVAENKYISYGAYERINASTVRVTELPVGMWTNKFKEIVDKMIVDELVDKVEYQHTDVEVDIILRYTNAVSDQTVRELLTGRPIGSNQTVIRNDSIETYTVQQYFDLYCDERMQLYERRRAYLLQQVEEQLACLNNRLRYIETVRAGIISIRNLTLPQLREQLTQMNFTHHKQLLDIRLTSLTLDECEKLIQQIRAKEAEQRRLQRATPKSLWLDDLAEFVVACQQYVNECDADDTHSPTFCSLQSALALKARISSMQAELERAQMDISEDDDVTAGDLW
jgi:DNA topoisomerase-2